MKLDRGDKSLLFSCTEIPDVFFTEHMPSMDGNYLKVYLYILFLSKHNNNVQITDLSKRLGLQYTDVTDALKYLEEQNLIIKLPDGYSITNIQELELTKLYSPKVSSSPEDIERNSKNQYRNKAIENINSLFFQGVMPPSMYEYIDLWFKKFGFDEEVMLALFNYCSERRALHHAYIEKVGEAWASHNIKNFNDLEAYELKQDKFNTIIKEISDKLRLSNKLTSFDEDLVVKWVNDYKYDMSIIELSLKKASSMKNVNFNYFDTILTDWHEKGLNTVEDILEYQQSRKDQTKKIKEIERKIPEFSYTQSTFDNLESLYDN